MTILNSLLDHNVWQDFLQSKKDGGHLSKADEKQLANFILQKRYIPVAQNILNGQNLPLPKVAQINKKDTGKKRLVFVFEQDFNMVLNCLHICCINMIIFLPTIFIRFAKQLA